MINQPNQMQVLLLLAKNNRLTKGAFTLVELLVVITIVAIVSYLAMPAMVSLTGAENFKGNVSQISDFMEGAHSAAIARNTYVWVGFSQVTATSGEGVEMASVYSEHGSPDDLANNNVLSLSRPIFLRNLALKTSLSNSIPNLAAGSVGFITDANNATFKTQISGSSQTLSYVVEITPSGQVMISSANKYAWIQFDLEPTHGNSQNAAVLQMNAFTGRVATFLP